MTTMATQETLQSLLLRLNSLTPASPRRWGKMTSHEMICHLIDSFQLALGERYASPATGFLQRTIMKWGALYVPVEWPKGTPTRPEMEQGKAGRERVEFHHDRTHLVSVIRRFTAVADFGAITHPFFGVLTTAQWKRWGYLHTDHHLRQFGA